MSARWTPEQIEELRGLIAKGYNARQLSDLLKRNRKAIISTAQRYDLGPWLSATGMVPRAATDVPTDFAEYWQSHSNLECSVHYNRSMGTVQAWTKQLGLQRPKGKHLSKPDAAPADFHKVASLLSLAELSAKYGRGKATIVRWRKEVGSTGGSKRLPVLGHPIARLVAPSRGHGEGAATYLQGNRGGGWSVFRCDEAGRQSQGGKFWRVGRMVLTDAEVIAMAERKGFNPDAWRQIAA